MLHWERSKNINPVMKLKAVLNTLEGVQIAGRENLDRLLGSMQAIDEVIQMLSAPPAPDKETEQEVADGR